MHHKTTAAALDIHYYLVIPNYTTESVALLLFLVIMKASMNAIYF
jgi:hypothetical protein